MKRKRPAPTTSAAPERIAGLVTETPTIEPDEVTIEDMRQVWVGLTYVGTMHRLKNLEEQGRLVSRLVKGKDGRTRRAWREVRMKDEG